MIDSDARLVVIEASNRAYLVAARRNAKLMRLLDQVSAMDENVRGSPPCLSFVVNMY